MSKAIHWVLLIILTAAGSGCIAPSVPIPGRGRTCGTTRSGTETYPIVRQRGDEVVSTAAPEPDYILVNGRACRTETWAITAARRSEEASSSTGPYDNTIHVTPKDEGCMSIHVEGRIGCECRTIKSTSPDQDDVVEQVEGGSPSWKRCECPTELVGTRPAPNFPVVVQNPELDGFRQTNARKQGTLGLTDASGALLVCPEAVAAIVAEHGWRNLITAIQSGRRAAPSLAPTDSVVARLEGKFSGHTIIASTDGTDPSLSRGTHVAALVLLPWTPPNRKNGLLPVEFADALAAELVWLRVDKQNIAEVRTFLALIEV